MKVRERGPELVSLLSTADLHAMEQLSILRNVVLHTAQVTRYKVFCFQFKDRSLAKKIDHLFIIQYTIGSHFSCMFVWLIGFYIVQ